MELDNTTMINDGLHFVESLIMANTPATVTWQGFVNLVSRIAVE